MDREMMIGIRRQAFQEAIDAITRKRNRSHRECDEGERVGLAFAILEVEKLMKEDAARVDAMFAAS
jgi:hypothetical protein